MRYIKTFENFSENNNSLIKSINSNELNKIIHLVDKELEKLNNKEISDVSENLEKFSKNNVNVINSNELGDVIKNANVVSNKYKHIYDEISSKESEFKNEFFDWGIFQKPLDFISDCIKFIQFRLGLISTVVLVIYNIFESLSNSSFSWWQLFWIIISLMIWRIQNVRLKKLREEDKKFGLGKPWYHSDYPKPEEPGTASSHSKKVHE